VRYFPFFTLVTSHIDRALSSFDTSRKRSGHRSLLRCHWHPWSCTMTRYRETADTVGDRTDFKLRMIACVHLAGFCIYLKDLKYRIPQ